MRSSKAVRQAAAAITLMGALALGSSALAGGLDDPGGIGMCGGTTPIVGCEATAVVVQPTSDSSPSPLTRLLAWRWIATWLLRH